MFRSHDLYRTSEPRTVHRKNPDLDEESKETSYKSNDFTKKDEFTQRTSLIKAKESEQTDFNVKLSALCPKR